jgi:hypothetical protein
MFSLGRTSLQVLRILKETLIIAIKQGGIAKVAISAVLKRIDSMVKCSPFLIVKVAPKGEIVKESNVLIITS